MKKRVCYTTLQQSSPLFPSFPIPSPAPESRRWQRRWRRRWSEKRPKNSSYSYNLLLCYYLQLLLPRDEGRRITEALFPFFFIVDTSGHCSLAQSATCYSATCCSASRCTSVIGLFSDDDDNDDVNEESINRATCKYVRVCTVTSEWLMNQWRKTFNFINNTRRHCTRSWQQVEEKPNENTRAYNFFFSGLFPIFFLYVGYDVRGTASIIYDWPCETDHAAVTVTDFAVCVCLGVLDYSAHRDDDERSYSSPSRSI